MAGNANNDSPADQESRHIQNRSEEIEDVTAREVKSTVKELVPKEMVTIVEKALDEALCKNLHSAQSDVQYVVNNIVEHVMLDLLRKDVIGKNFDAHIAKLFETNEPGEELLKRLLTSTSFITRTATFVRPNTNTAMKDKGYSPYVAPKAPGNTIPTFTTKATRYRADLTPERSKYPVRSCLNAARIIVTISKQERK